MSQRTREPLRGSTSSSSTRSELPTSPRRSILEGCITSPKRFSELPFIFFVMPESSQDRIMGEVSQSFPTLSHRLPERLPQTRSLTIAIRQFYQTRSGLSVLMDLLAASRILIDSSPCSAGTGGEGLPPLRKDRSCLISTEKVLLMGKAPS